MIVITKTEAEKFGEQKAPVGIYKPIEIKGGLFVLPDECEDMAKGERRKILDAEWIIAEKP